MPPAPELSDGTRKIGRVEVRRQLKAQQLGSAQRHERVAGKIKIQLQPVAQRAEGERQACIRRYVAVNSVGKHRQKVGHGHLGAQPQRKGDQRVGRAVRTQGAGRAQLRQQFVPAHDGAAGDEREKAYEQREITGARLGRVFFAVYIHGVANGLHREKADAQRQDDGKSAAARFTGEAQTGQCLPKPCADGRAVEQQRGAFQQHQKAEVYAQRGPEPPFAGETLGGVHAAHQRPRGQGIQNQHGQPCRGIEAIKRIADGQQRGVLPAPGNKPAYKHRQREECKERNGVECHSAHPISTEYGPRRRARPGARESLLHYKGGQAFCKGRGLPAARGKAEGTAALMPGRQKSLLLLLFSPFYIILNWYRCAKETAVFGHAAAHRLRYPRCLLSGSQRCPPRRCPAARLKASRAPAGRCCFYTRIP